MDDETVKTRVIVVGAGPVGLTLAIDLGRRGIPTLLIERKDAPAHLPKMERCNARTMEIFRQLDIADRVRAAGLPANVPMDVYITTRLIDEPILHLPYPSPSGAAQLIRTTHDGTSPLESQQLISQYALEPLLRQVAEEQPAVDVRYGCRLESFDQDPHGVTVHLASADDRTEKVRAEYLVGCDGGASTVRRALDITLTGKDDLGTLRQVFFRSDELVKRVPVTGRARHFYFADDDPRMIGAAMVVQSDQRHFTFHTGVPEDSDFTSIIQDTIGIPLDLDVLAVTSWTLHLLVADRYRNGRVLLAGDSAHLVIPQGGLGMNTGIGDATDLAWKLAAMLDGSGGPSLLDSYEIERRQVAQRNLHASEYAARGTATWREASTNQVATASPEGERVRARVAALADVHQRKGHEMTGIELGYRYVGSPVISYDITDDAADGFAYSYQPQTAPGYRLPHSWCTDEIAVHDRLGPGFNLLRLAGTTSDTHELEHAIRGTGAALAVHDLSEPHLRNVYGADLLLIRPDLHVAWRSDQPPKDPASLAALVTGQAHKSVEFPGGSDLRDCEYIRGV